MFIKLKVIAVAAVVVDKLHGSKNRPKPKIEPARKKPVSSEVHVAPVPIEIATTSEKSTGEWANDLGPTPYMKLAGDEYVFCAYACPIERSKLPEIERIGQNRSVKQYPFYNKEDGDFVLVSRDAFKGLANIVFDGSEHGGVLFGEYLEEDAIRINKFQQMEDKSRTNRSFFALPSNWLTQVADIQRSNRDCQLIGIAHSHPDRSDRYYDWLSYPDVGTFDNHLDCFPEKPFYITPIVLKRTGREANAEFEYTIQQRQDYRVTVKFFKIFQTG
jgi:hypothetical protein